MDLLTRIEASLEFMNDGGPIRVDFVNLREVLEGSREALLKLDRYEQLLATAYQLAGLVGAPVRFLDAYALHDGTDADSLLPVGLDELEEFKALASRLGAVEDELRHSVSVMSIVRSWLLENVRGSTHWENCEREHATCRAISQLGGVVERLSRLNLTAAGRESLQNVPQIGPGRIPQT